MNNPSSDQWRFNEANRRLDILNRVNALTAPAEGVGLSERKACKRIGVDQATFGRWKKRYAQRGFNGLVPNTAECGRNPMLEELLPDATQRKAVVDAVQGLNADLDSNTAAWRLFAASDKCPEQLARVVLDPNKCSKHSLPPSLRAATKLTQPVKEAHRGRRSLDLNGIWIPRYVDILPGDIFTSDDTTPIWAWWVPWYESKEYPFGVKLLQGQWLPIMDVASQAVICHALIAREKSSYRAADIWALFGHAFDTVGLPRLGFQLERGSWESNIIRGEQVDYGDGDVTFSRRVGGLRQLPTNVTPWHIERHGDAMGAFPKTLQTWTSYLPKSKSIEAFFHRSQMLEGTLWGALGRDQMRKPFEKTKKIFQACQRGVEDPRKHFLSHTEIVTRINSLLQYLNYEPMEGEVFHGIPQLKWDQAVRGRPLLRLPDEQRWLYARDWRRATITNGWARVRLTHEISGERYSLFYIHPEVFAQIEGAEVFVYYDRENFEQPAQIVAGTSVVVNDQRYDAGQWICEAQYFERKGSFLSGDMTGHDIRKRWRNAVLTTYGTIVKHAPSRQVPEEITRRRESFRTGTIDVNTDCKAAASAPQRDCTPFIPANDERTRRHETFDRQADIARRLREMHEE